MPFCVLRMLAVCISYLIKKQEQLTLYAAFLGCGGCSSGSGTWSCGKMGNIVCTTTFTCVVRACVVDVYTYTYMSAMHMADVHAWGREVWQRVFG